MSAGASIKAGKAVVEASIDDRTFGTKLSAMSAKMKAFGESVKSAGSRIRGAGMNLAIGSVIGAIPAALSVREFMQFDDAMRAVAGTSQATSAELEALTNNALELGKTTSYTNAEVANLQLELSRAGFKPDEIIQSTESILDLARATGTELPRAAEIGANVLRAFGLDASEMARVSDVAGAATSKSAQTLEDYFEAIKYVAPNARQAGLSIEETSAAIGILADVGIKGSLAGTALRNSILRLSNPTGAAADELAKLGVATMDASGNLRNPLVVMKELRESMGRLGYGSAEVIAAFQEIFEVRGGAAALVLSQSYDQVQNLNGELQQASGFVQGVADMMDAGIGGQWRMMTSAISDFATRAGKAMSGTIGKLFEGITFIANKLSELIDSNPQLANMFLLLISGSAAAGLALIVLGTAIGTIGGAIAGLVSVGSVIAGLVSTIGLPVLAIAAGIAVLIGSLALASAAGVAMTLMFVDWKVAVHEFEQVWNAFIKPFYANFSAIETFLRSGQLGKAGETAMLTLGLAFVRGGRELLTHVESMLFNLVTAHSKAFIEIVKLGARFQIELAKAMLTGQANPKNLLSFDGILESIDAPLAAAEDRLRKRLSELRREAKAISDAEAVKLADEKWNSFWNGENAKPAAAPAIDPALQAAIDAMKEAADDAADRAGAAATRMSRGMERMQVETAGIFSGKAQLPMARTMDRQVELLESIDETLDTIKNKPASGLLEWDA